MNGIKILFALSIYNDFTLQFFDILLRYSNPPEQKINNGILKGLKGYDISLQNWWFSPVDISISWTWNMTTNRILSPRRNESHSTLLDTGTDILS